MNIKVMYVMFAAGSFATAYLLFVARRYDLAIVASVLTLTSAFAIFVGHAGMEEHKGGVQQELKHP
jgi:hypothetical protein